MSVPRHAPRSMPTRPPAVAKPPQRRHRTGRNAQLNLKVTPETLTQFTAIADREKWLLAETLEHALDLLERTLARRRKKRTRRGRNGHN